MADGNIHSTSSPEILRRHLVVLQLTMVTSFLFPYTRATMGVSDTGFLPGETDCPDIVDVRIFFSSKAISAGTKHRALHTAPSGFQIRPSTIAQAGMGVFSTSFIKSNLWLGEYEGTFRPSNQSSTRYQRDYSWSVYRSNVLTHSVDASDVTHSNWLRYINCARHVREENVGMTMCYGRVHYRTLKDIVPGEELFIYYGRFYAERLGINVKQFKNLSYDYLAEWRT